MAGTRRETTGQEEACAELLQPGRPEDEGLLERLARCLGNDLQLHAQRRCGNPHDAEDAVQEAMATAMRYLSGFRGDTSLRAWLRRLVNTACIHQRRGRRNDPMIHASVEAEESAGRVLPDQGPVAEEALLARERLSHVAQVLGSLPEEDRQLLLRHEGEEVPLATLAEETGSSVAAIRSRLYRVRQRLRAELEALAEDRPAQEEER